MTGIIFNSVYEYLEKCNPLPVKQRRIQQKQPSDKKLTFIGGKMFVKAEENNLGWYVQHPIELLFAVVPNGT